MIELIVADEFESAFVGLVERYGGNFALYDKDKCLEILEKDGMSPEEAIEYMDFNTLGAFYGFSTPGFLTRCSLEDLDESNR